jgi:hypothetical protein
MFKKPRILGWFKIGNVTYEKMLPRKKRKNVFTANIKICVSFFVLTGKNLQQKKLKALAHLGLTSLEQLSPCLLMSKTLNSSICSAKLGYSASDRH